MEVNSNYGQAQARSACSTSGEWGMSGKELSGHLPLRPRKKGEGFDSLLLCA